MTALAAVTTGGDVDVDAGVDGPLAQALADELVALTGHLSDLAFDLGSNPEILRNHMGSLQAIDFITQVQLALSEVLRGQGPLDARLNTIGLAELATRLRAAAC